ncbi:unnamed protein product, partial [Medioppia subpectinata]
MFIADIDIVLRVSVKCVKLLWSVLKALIAMLAMRHSTPSEAVVTSKSPLQAFSAYGRQQLLTTTLFGIYKRQIQTHEIYEMKTGLRHRFYTLFSTQMKEKIDLYLIGSSLTGFGSNTSDTDFCLIIYDSNEEIDKKYDNKDQVLTKLEELK